MDRRDRLNNTLIGSAGEYFVAGELSRNGVVAALTMSGTDAFDILAVNQTGRQFAIQVKTTRHEKEPWLLGKKDEETRADNAYYVFVRLKGTGLPEYYVVPAKDVAEAILRKHQKWLETPGKNGSPHKDHDMREFQITQGDERYYNRWDRFTGEESEESCATASSS